MWPIVSGVVKTSMDRAATPPAMYGNTEHRKCQMPFLNAKAAHELPGPAPVACAVLGPGQKRSKPAVQVCNATRRRNLMWCILTHFCTCPSAQCRLHATTRQGGTRLILAQQAPALAPHVRTHTPYARQHRTRRSWVPPPRQKKVVSECPPTRKPNKGYEPPKKTRCFASATGTTQPRANRHTSPPV